EAHAELSSFEIIEGEVAEALQEKVEKINQLNALISESVAALEAVLGRIKQHVYPPKLLLEEQKLHEKKLKKFRLEKAAFESITFVEIGDLSDEMRKYSIPEELEEEVKEGKASF